MLLKNAVEASQVVLWSLSDLKLNKWFCNHFLIKKKQTCTFPQDLVALHAEPNRLTFVCDVITGFKVTVQACSDGKFHFISFDLFFLLSLFFHFPVLLWELTRLYLIGKCFTKMPWVVNVFKRGTSGDWSKIFVGMFWLNVHDILCFSLAYWINCVC